MNVLTHISVIAILAVWEGYAITILWRWFIVPTFNAPVLSIPAAIGIALLVGMLTHKTMKPEDTPGYWLVMAYGAAVPGIAIFSGWIAKWWM